MTDKYDRIGDTYDTTRAPDPEVRDALARLIDLQPSYQYLDVGCGTGNYTAALNKLGGSWTGLEPSSRMLGAARPKDNNITWVQGGAETLPFESDTFDGAICTLAIHHFTNHSAAFREFDRVLRPGGRLVIFTATPDQVRAFWLARYFPEMIERDVQQLPSLDQIKSYLEPTGLRVVGVEPFFVSNETADFFFFSGKFRPSMYLSETVRSGISSFKTLISSDELKRGLATLERDIESGSIDQIIADSLTDLGDYCFVVIQGK